MLVNECLYLSLLRGRVAAETSLSGFGCLFKILKSELFICSLFPDVFFPPQSVGLQ